MALPPRLLLVTPAVLNLSILGEVLPRLSDHVDAVLLRWPAASARQVWQAAGVLADVRPRPALVLSDRADIARAARLEGVHVKDAGLPPARVRAWGLPVVGASRHPPRETIAPEEADYVTASPVFATSSKPGAASIGLEGLARFCAESAVPVLALGGIDVSRVAPCRRAGAYGIAVLSAVWSAKDPAAEAEAIRRALDAT